MPMSQSLQLSMRGDHSKLKAIKGAVSCPVPEANDAKHVKNAVTSPVNVGNIAEAVVPHNVITHPEE
jgi:hypothetical protein